MPIVVLFLVIVGIPIAIGLFYWFMVNIFAPVILPAIGVVLVSWLVIEGVRKGKESYDKDKAAREERERIQHAVNERQRLLASLQSAAEEIASTDSTQLVVRVVEPLNLPGYLFEPTCLAVLELILPEQRLARETIANPSRFESVYHYGDARERLVEMTNELRKLIGRLPRPDVQAGPFTTSYLHLMPEPLSTLQPFVDFAAYDMHRSVLGALRNQFYLNRDSLADFKGSPREAAKGFFANTPFLQIMEAQLPFGFPDEARFRHQWVVGDTGAGKTTFLSAMIAEDLKRVERNEASLFIMDSQNELIPDIARLAQFAPGGLLFGKLVYLEPDPDFPLALNIFDTGSHRYAHLSSTDRMMLERSALWMVDFFLSSLVKAEASPHQDIFLKYVIPALMAIPNATIFTFKELLESAPRNGRPPGYEKYKHHFSGLRPDTQQWLAERMHSPELAPTRNAIRARLDGFTADPFFHDMFIHPRNKLDLFSELQTGKVILVNTMKGLLKSGTEAFGRYFIARLVQAMEERTLLAREERLPVFAYIDEASDYIAEEQNIEELIDKARKQRMAFVFANQREAQITSPTVRDALSRAAIQCRGQARSSGEPPVWNVSINHAEPIAVGVPNVRFQDMPRMSDIEFQGMMIEMRRNYSGVAAPHGHRAYRPNGGPQEDSGDIIEAEYEVVEDRLKITAQPRPGDSEDPTRWG